MFGVLPGMLARISSGDASFLKGCLVFDSSMCLSRDASWVIGGVVSGLSSRVTIGVSSFFVAAL